MLGETGISGELTSFIATDMIRNKFSTTNAKIVEFVMALLIQLLIQVILEYISN